MYLFLLGRRYTDALADFALVAGKMDMPPLSAWQEALNSTEHGAP